MGEAAESRIHRAQSWLDSLQRTCRVGWPAWVTRNCTQLFGSAASRPPRYVAPPCLHVLKVTDVLAQSVRSGGEPDVQTPAGTQANRWATSAETLRVEAADRGGTETGAFRKDQLASPAGRWSPTSAACGSPAAGSPARTVASPESRWLPTIRSCRCPVTGLAAAASAQPNVTCLVAGNGGEDCGDLDTLRLDTEGGSLCRAELVHPTRTRQPRVKDTVRRIRPTLNLTSVDVWAHHRRDNSTTATPTDVGFDQAILMPKKRSRTFGTSAQQHASVTSDQRISGSFEVFGWCGG